MTKQKRKLNINLKPLIKRLESITKRKVKTRLMGNYASVFRGTGGFEFEGYREYTLNDDASMIDWKASARANKLLVKVLKQERALEVFFLVDVSESMIFGSTTKLKNEYSAELIGTLAFAISAAGDKFGFATFSNKVSNILPPSRGINHFYRLCKILTNPDVYGGNCNFVEALDFALSYVKRRSTLVFFVSDFVGLKGEWEKKLKLLCSKCDVVMIMIRDPRDETLPEDTNLVLVEDPYSKRRLIIDPKLIKHHYESYVKREENSLREAFIRAGADFLKLSTAENFITPLVGFFIRRRRKWR